MKIHTTNYINTFILVADDCPSNAGKVPPHNDNLKSIANIQYDIISCNPYKYSSDEVIFMVYAYRNNILESDYDFARLELFSRGQACLRSSPLTKRYGWGIHFNHEGKLALSGMESNEYQKFVEDQKVIKTKAMRSSREKIF